MAPGSRGIGAVFRALLPAKIPVKRGMLSANREFHDVAGVIIFPTHPGSRINLLRAGKTLRAKAAVREKKCVLLPARFFSNLVPVPDSRESELGLVRYGPASRVHRGVFGPFEGSFPIRIPADPDKFLAIREFHVVHGCVLFPMCPGSQINLLRVRKTLCASVATSLPMSDFDDLGIVGKLALPTFQRYRPCTEASLGSQDMILANGGRRNVPYAKGNVGQRINDSIFARWDFLGFRACPQSFESNVGWFNGLAFESKHVGEVNLRLQICPSLKLGGSTVWHLNPNTLRGDLTWGLPKLGKSSGPTAWHLNPNTLRGDLTWGLPKLQIEWSNGLAFESKHVGEVNLRLQICPSLKLGGSTVWHLNPNTLRGDLTWGLPKLQIEWSNGLAFESKHVGEVNLRLQICPSLKLGGSTVWHLNPNTLRGDLTWGLPKLQIEWSNGLAFESKHVGEVNLRLQICPSLKLGGSTVWHLNPNTLRGDLTWGLPKLQIEWSNGLAFESKHVGEVNLRLQICPSLKLGGSTVWHLNPNTLRGDLTWGLPKLQIEWSNGLAFESKHVEGCKSSGPTAWHLNPNTLRGDLTWGLPKLQIEWSNGLAFESKHVGEVNLSLQICPSLKLGGSTVWHLNPNTLRGDLTWGLPKLQIEWSNGLAFESKHVGEVNLRLQICPSLKLGGSTVWHLNPNTLRGDLTWGLPKLQIEWSNGLAFESKHVGEVNLRLQICPSLKLGGSTVWHLNPNTLRGDLTWGLPKLQIEWSNGLAFESKHVGEVNLRLQICPSLKLGGSTVWHLNPNTLRGDLTWGLPKLQIEWSNGLAFESKHVGEVNLRLQICPSLKLGGSTVWHLNPNTLRGDLTWGLPKLQIEWSNGLAFESKHVEGCKSSGPTAWHLNPNTLRGDLTWGLPKLQIEWSNGLAFESKHVGEVNLSLQICPSLKLGGSTVWHLNPNTLRGDLTWGLPKLQIEWSNGLAFESKHVGEVNLRLQICPSLKLGGSTVWHLNPNTLRGDLTWGLPKLQIEWSNGLAFESKHVGEVNLRLQICPSLKLGGSTVWHLNPNTLRGDLTWGLPKLQIEWSNGLAFESKHVGEVNLSLQICPSLKLGGSTVWHLNPNTLRGDLTWGLPKLQIEWSNGLAFESKHVEGCKSSGPTAWHLNPNTLRGDLTWGLPKLQIEWSNGLAFESKHVGEVNLSLQICPSLKLGGSTVWHLNPNTLRGDLTWGLPKLQIEWSNGLAFESKHVGEVNLRLQICPSLKLGGSTVWHLNPNTLRGDLTWGLPKLQIEWSNGLAFESKHVGEVNLRLQICPSLKLGGSTVWHLNPNTLRGDLTWGLPKLQIEWSNGLAFESKHVGEVNLRLQICPSLKLGGSTVWHLNPNTLRGDLTWGLPKLQIEWSNGLAFESKHVEG
uniref:Uncharacterized protein n=1 Tax=Fagus sylvatica TaxID=28930 RepID=A0A2N9FZX4_FAGSY